MKPSTRAANDPTHDGVPCHEQICKAETVRRGTPGEKPILLRHEHRRPQQSLPECKPTGRRRSERADRESNCGTAEYCFSGRETREGANGIGLCGHGKDDMPQGVRSGSSTLAHPLPDGKIISMFSIMHLQVPLPWAVAVDCGMLRSSVVTSCVFACFLCCRGREDVSSR